MRACADHCLRSWATALDAKPDALATSTGKELNISRRLARENTLPILILLFLYVGLWLLWSLSKRLLEGCRAVCSSSLNDAMQRRGKAVTAPYTSPFAVAVSPQEYALHPFLEDHEVAVGWRYMRDEWGAYYRIR